MKNTVSKIKPIKADCLGRKDYTNNFKPQEMKMAKTRFLKQKYNN